MTWQRILREVLKMTETQQAVKEAVMAERERCAALVRCEKLPMDNPRNELLESIAQSIELGSRP